VTGWEAKRKGGAGPGVGVGESLECPAPYLVRISYHGDSEGHSDKASQGFENLQGHSKERNER
jgi:hypothetical protein